MSVNSIWLIVCGAGAIQSLFLSIYILSSKRIEIQERVLLSALLFAISLRLIKSIGWFFLDINQIGFLNMGFVAHGFIGPILVLYLLWKISEKPTKKSHQAFIISPAILLFLVSPIIDLHNFWYVGGYQVLLYTTILYLAWALILISRLYRKKPTNFSWIRNLFLGVALFCISFFTNYILGLNSYILGPILYSLIIYLISFIVFSNYEIFKTNKASKKYQNLNLTHEQIQNHKEKVTRVMEEEKPYLNSDFNLTILSEKTMIPKHMLSRFFSENMNLNFSDFTNSYRVEEAKKMLTDSSYKNHKIAFIAYDCGFHSLSSFNNAFKKMTSVSPSEFRKQNQSTHAQPL